MIKPFGPSYSPSRDRYFHEPVTNALAQMMDVRTPFRSYIYNVVEGSIREHLMIATRPAGNTFTEMLTTLGISLNQFSAKNVVATRISEGNATNFIVKMMTTLMLGRWFKLDYMIDMSHFDITTLVECFVLKLFTPKRLWSDATVTNIDNYIALHFFMKMAAYTGDLNASDVINSSQNHLARVLSNMSEFASFLVTTDVGGGWSGAGLTPDRQILRKAEDVPFFPNDLIFEPIYAVTNEDDLPTNMAMFVNFVGKLTTIGTSRTGRPSTTIQAKSNTVTDIRPVVDLLDKISQMATSIGRYMFLLNEFARQFSFVPWCYQTSDRDPDYQMTWVTSDNDTPMYSGLTEKQYAIQINGSSRAVMRDSILVAAGDAVAVPFVTNLTAVNTWGSMIPTIWRGFSLFTSLHEFTGLHAVAMKYLPKPWYKSGDRLNWAIDHMTTFLKTALKLAFADMKVFIVANAGSHMMLRKFRCAEDYLQGAEHMHGLATRVYFNAMKASAVEWPQFKYYTISAKQNGKDITAEDFITLYEQEKLTSITLDALDSGESLIFAVPVPLTWNIASKSSIASEAAVFNVESNGLNVSPVHQYVMWSDDRLRPLRETNEFAFVRPPAFTTDVVPFIPITPQQVMGLVKTVTVLKELKFFSISNFELQARNAVS
jgi:hypothetical protein